jgi:fatty-acyl-CoA synthase
VAEESPISTPVATDPELGLLILYTSGTTGAAKAALISQRALIARMLLLQTDLKIERQDGFIAWSPMFHMGGSEHSISTLMMGGAVFVVDGFDPERMATVIGEEVLGWLLLVPATIDRLVEALDRQGVTPRGIRCCGAMADLLPKRQLAAITSRLRAPFLNTFGATETGIAPASSHLIPPGEEPESLSKRLNFLCALRLVNDAGEDVEPGAVGEAAVRGPTLFSGYWANEAANQNHFQDGWFRMGDLFSRNPDGSYDFQGRSKYLIKSGGENIYPAEIEGILLADHRVDEAVVLASRDAKWGEVPVAVVAADVDDPDALAETLLAECRDRLAGYKCPRKILFLPLERFLRNTSGKVDRNQIAKDLIAEGVIE